MFRSVQFSTPRIRSVDVLVVLNIGAHFSQQVNQVGNLRLSRGIFQDGFAVGQRRSHQNIFRAGYGDFFKDDVRAFQAAVDWNFGFDVSV